MHEHTDTPARYGRYAQWAEAGRRDEAIERAEASALLEAPESDLLAIAAAAGTVRERFFGRAVRIHVLDNVRNAACPEDCGYCGQSKDSDAPVAPYKLKRVDDIVADAEAAKRSGAYRFCMAISRRGPSDADVDHVARAIERISGMGLRTCLSAGLLDEAKARRLKAAGLDRLNHNLNTSERHYPAICTTHTYADRIATLRAAREAGLGVCSGLIVGMDETREDLLEVAYALREIGAESVPVNFLLPIEGNRLDTPRHEERALDPRFVLRVLCLFRLVNPSAEVRIAAGREHHLGHLQAMSLWPANSLFMEGYLLTQGQEGADTVRMIRDAGFVPELEGAEWPESLRAILAERGDEAPKVGSEGMKPAVVSGSSGPPWGESDKAG